MKDCFMEILICNLGVDEEEDKRQVHFCISLTFVYQCEFHSRMYFWTLKLYLVLLHFYSRDSYKSVQLSFLG